MVGRTTWKIREHSVKVVCSNKVQPSLENLIEIAKILDIDIHKLITSTKETGL